MTRNTKIAVGLSVAMALFIGAYFGSPILALHNLSQAAKAGDRERLEQAVDFPAVRTSLKAQLSAALITSMSADPNMKDNTFRGMGLLLVPAIIDRAIETYVTPDAIATMVTTAKTPTSPPPPSVGPAPTTPPPGKLDTHYSFSEMGRFRVDVHDPDAPHSAGKLGLIFERRGLFTWKLIRIDVPLAPVSPTSAP